MHHPVFGEIEWQKAMRSWAGRVQLAFFSAYDATWAEGMGSTTSHKAADHRHQQGDFALWLIGPDDGMPSRRQERAFRQFLDDRDVICNRVADAIFDLYQGNWGSWRGTAEPDKAEEHMDDLRVPELHSRDGLRRVIRLEALSVLDCPQDNVALLGFCFECAWDVEHGLGVLVRQGGVVEVGENDITWGAPEFAGRRGSPWVPTSQQIVEQRGIAAIKKLGGSEMLDARQPGAPSYVAQVDLSRNKQVTDADLKVLSQFPTLRQLALASPAVTDAGLRAIPFTEA
jgi:hypothetical protein